MGFAQSLIGGYAQAGQYDALKRQSLIQGEAQRDAAYAKATASEQASKSNLRQVGEKMARMAGNRRREEGAARAFAATQGFAPEGSSTKREELVGKAYADAMEDMARSGSVASKNALNEQVALRRGGDAAMAAAEAQAEQYRAMAKATRTGAFLISVGGALGAAGGGLDALSAYAQKDKDGNVQWDTLNWDKVDWKHVAGKSIYGAGGTAGVISAFGPFTSDFAGKDWEKQYLDMLGIGKLK